jgi:hypothetical protein
MTTAILMHTFFFLPELVRVSITLSLFISIIRTYMAMYRPSSLWLKVRMFLGPVSGILEMPIFANLYYRPITDVLAYQLPDIFENSVFRRGRADITQDIFPFPYATSHKQNRQPTGACAVPPGPQATPGSTMSPPTRLRSPYPRHVALPSNESCGLALMFNLHRAITRTL